VGQALVRQTLWTAVVWDLAGQLRMSCSAATHCGTGGRGSTAVAATASSAPPTAHLSAAHPAIQLPAPHHGHVMHRHERAVLGVAHGGRLRDDAAHTTPRGPANAGWVEGCNWVHSGSDVGAWTDSQGASSPSRSLPPPPYPTPTLTAHQAPAVPSCPCCVRAMTRPRRTPAISV
jgi:hypothetical protein